MDDACTVTVAEKMAATELSMAVSCLTKTGEIELDFDGRLLGEKQKRMKKCKKLWYMMGEDEEEFTMCEEGRLKYFSRQDDRKAKRRGTEERGML